LKNNKIKTISIKKRLIISIVSITTLLILLSWAFIVNQTKHEIKEVYDARLSQSAKILALTMPNIMKTSIHKQAALYEYWFKTMQEMTTSDDSETTLGHPYEKNFIFQFYKENQLVFKSPNAPKKALSKINTAGFGILEVDNEQWRYFQLKIPNDKQENIYILVAEKQKIRDEVITEIALSTSLPQLLLIPALFFVTLFLVNKFLSPITELQKAVSLRNINNLKPLFVNHPTVELHPLITQLNYLLEQLNNAWEREKRFTRTAAHELKTPLAILRLNAENALKTDNQKEQRSDLNNIITSINRTDRLIQQLLMHSRIEGQHNIESTAINITSILREVIAELVPLALQQQQQISLHPIENCEINGNATLLAILFTNLIDNAIRYSGKESNITIKMQNNKNTESNILQILIIDDGEKIQNNIRERIFEKFFRANSGKGDGAGLGMSIADDIVKQHHGTLELQDYSKNNRNVFIISLTYRNIS
jgi:two-component system sensor histidine kinase QseC